VPPKVFLLTEAEAALERIEEPNADDDCVVDVDMAYFFLSYSNIFLGQMMIFLAFVMNCKGILKMYFVYLWKSYRLVNSFRIFVRT